MGDHEQLAELQSLDPVDRVRAIESILNEKGVTSTDAIDNIISTYEEDVGPLNGKKVVARAWVDPEYKQRLLETPIEAIEEVCGDLAGQEIEVVENTDEVHNVLVCSLCSCYPWTLLGMAPGWYKTPQYRSRMVKEPRKLLSEEFGLDIDDDREIRVWDANSELRYMVLPMRPEGTEDMDEEELQELVTRASMTGVAKVYPDETRPEPAPKLK
jgi:nitrile hydratase